MGNYNLRMDKYGISKNVYHELKALCLQYAELKIKASGNLGLSAVVITGMPGSSAISNPTAEQAEKRIMAAIDDITAIETALKQAAADDSTRFALRLNVTEGIPFERLPVYLSRRHFYEVRRRFFYHLAKIKGKI